MIELKATTSAEQAHDLTSAIWRHTQELAQGSLAQAPEIRRIIDQCPDAVRGGELQAFVDQIDALELSEQRLFTAAIDDIQVRSKLWLIEELASRRDLNGATMVILGAWYGILPLLLNWRLELPPTRMICVDISAEACVLGERVIGPLYPNIEYQVGDAMDLDYPRIARDPGSVLINTICEHLSDAVTWWKRVSPGQFTVLQSNNYELCKDHVNCVQNLDEMRTQTPLSEPLYEGVLQLPIFDRFMLIGRR